MNRFQHIPYLIFVNNFQHIPYIELIKLDAYSYRLYRIYFFGILCNEKMQLEMLLMLYHDQENFSYLEKYRKPNIA